MPKSVTKQIPNAITCCNLMSGGIATMFAFDHCFIMAFTFIIIGAVFDFFDGFSARLLHVSSPIGKELDSLADDVTFGLAPASIVLTFLKDFQFCSEGWMQLIPYIALLIAAFSALRLAKFNLDERQTASFVGLATPANALFWGAFVITASESQWFQTSAAGLLVMLCLVLLSCWLLVAEIPMFAFKFKTYAFGPNKVRYIFLFLSVLLIVLGLVLGFGIAGVAAAIVLYILLSLKFGKC